MSHVKENTSKGGEFLTIFFLFNFWWQEFRWEIEHQSIEVSFQNFCQENLVSLVPNCPASSHKITYNLKVWLCYPAKGQLISKCPFGVKISSKKTNKFFSRISALASKKRSNQKNKGTLHHCTNWRISFWLSYTTFLIWPLFWGQGRNPGIFFVVFLEVVLTPEGHLKSTDLQQN